VTAWACDGRHQAEADDNRDFVRQHQAVAQEAIPNLTGDVRSERVEFSCAQNETGVVS